MQDVFLLFRDEVLNPPPRSVNRIQLALDLQKAFDNISHDARTHRPTRGKRKLALALEEDPELGLAIYADDGTLWVTKGPYGHRQGSLQRAINTTVNTRSLSTLALVRPGALPWSDSNRSGPGHSHLRNPEAVFAAEVQDIMAPEGDTTAEAPRLQSPAPGQETRDRGSFVLLPAELYTNSSRQFFCFYQALAERPESAGLLFGLYIFPYHLCTHAVPCCAHVNGSRLHIEALTEADKFPRYQHLRPMIGFSGKKPTAMMTGSDWMFLESVLVWLKPRGYGGAVLLWRVSLDTLAARRGYTDLLERMAHRFEKERIMLSVLVDTGDSLKQRLDLGELEASVPTGAEGPTAASILLHPIVGEPPLARTRGVEDQRSAVLEESRLQDTLKQLQSTMKQKEEQPRSHSLGASFRGHYSPGGSEEAASKLCYVLSFAGVTYKFWDSNVTGVQEVWDSSQVFELVVVSKQGANWVSHLTEFMVPPLARFMRDKFRARCFGVCNLWHDESPASAGAGRTRS
ncbi:uncharacterized protein LOC144119840 [Amblyomma americanum]